MTDLRRSTLRSVKYHQHCVMRSDMVNSHASRELHQNGKGHGSPAGFPWVWEYIAQISHGNGT